MCNGGLSIAPLAQENRASESRLQDASNQQDLRKADHSESQLALTGGCNVKKGVFYEILTEAVKASSRHARESKATDGENTTKD